MTPCQIKPMYIGDSPEFLIEAFLPDGVTPYSLTGHTIWLTFKRSQADLDAAAISQMSTTEGNITIKVAPDDNQAVAVPPSVDTASLTSGVTVFVGARIKTPLGRIYTVYEGTMALVMPTTRATI